MPRADSLTSTIPLAPSDNASKQIMRTYTVGEKPQGGYMLFNRVSGGPVASLQTLVNPELLSSFRPKGFFLRLEYSAQNITEYIKEAILASTFGVGSKETDAEDDLRITRWKWSTTRSDSKISGDDSDKVLQHEGDLSLTFTNCSNGQVGGHPFEASDVLVRIG